MTLIFYLNNIYLSFCYFYETKIIFCYFIPV